MAKLRASDAEIAAARFALFPKVSLSANIRGNIGQLNVNKSPYFPVAKLTLAQSKREETAAALKELTDQALREVALAYD